MIDWSLDVAVINHLTHIQNYHQNIYSLIHTSTKKSFYPTIKKCLITCMIFILQLCHYYVTT